jgi:hypothetical protein
MNTPTRQALFVFYVSSQERSCAFYRAVLNLAAYSLDPSGHVLAFAERSRSGAVE